MPNPNSLIRYAAIAALPFVFGGCFIPNMQSARTLKEGESRLTPYFAQIKNDEANAEPVYLLGGFLGVGVGEKLEWQFRFDHFTAFEPNEDGYSFISLGPKIAAVQDKLAFMIPLGMYTPSFQTLQIHPGVILTPFSTRYVELTAAGRLVLPFHQDLNKWAVFNLGLGLSNDLNRWAIMPEIGVAKDLTYDKQDLLVSYGAAMVFYFGDPE